MEAKLMYTKESPQETANLVSRLFFGWMKEIFFKGAKKDLTLSDLYHPLIVDKSKVLTDRLQKYWNWELQKWEQRQKEMPYDKKSNEKNTPRLEKALFRAFWMKYFCIGLLLSIQYIILIVLVPIMVSWIITYFKIEENVEPITETEALTYVSYLIICVTLSVFIMHHTEFMSQQMGMRLRIACCSLIYRKILRLSKGALTQINSGQVVNLLSNDVSRFDELCYYLNFLWITPIQIIFVTVIMWHKAGLPSIIGVAILLLITIPNHTVFLSLVRQIRKIVATLTDSRVQLMNELISGIEVVKMYAWEKPFEKIVAATRATEIKKISLTSYIRAGYLALVVFTNRTVLFLTLLSFVLMESFPRAEVTFMLFSYFEILQLTTTLMFPQALLLAGETLVSIRRLEKFLLLEEQSNDVKVVAQMYQNKTLKFKNRKAEKENVESIRMTNGSQNLNLNNDEEQVPISIALERVSANWTPNKLPPTLCNVSMRIENGELCALVGPVGSGKSSILQLLLRELPLGAGKLHLRYKSSKNTEIKEQEYVVNVTNLKISYASQDAWLFTGTVRDNILFGQPYDKDRYIAVTQACALVKDFQQFPYGDMSNVGEDGSSLSGGQKARVNLARAVYRKADIYLLDDPLSAVDARVAKHLFYRCIKNYLHGKTRILVTHQLQFIKQADVIVALDRGFIKMHGTYEELSKSNKDFSDMMNRIKMSTEAKKESKVESENSFRERRVSGKNGLRKLSTITSTSSMSSFNYEGEKSAPENNEAIASGRLPIKIYKQYFQYGGSCLTLIALLFVVIVSQVATSGNDYWVSYWTNLEIIRRSITNSTQPFKRQYSFYFLNGTALSNVFNLDNYGLMTTTDALYVYTFCIISCIVTVFVRNLFFMKVCMVANKNLHSSMFSNVLQAAMTFFHQNTSGRILNRFSKDMGAIDEILPKVMLETIQIFLVISGVLCMVVAVNNWMLIPLAVLFVFLLIVRSSYLRTVQSVKRIESIAKSPIFSHVNATLNGLTTIRSSGSNVLELLQKQFDDLQDVHTGAWYMTIAVPVTFGLYLDIVVIIFVACVCFSSILINTGDVLGGNVGLVISQSLIVIGTLQHGVKQSGEMMSNITSVERILQYTNLPKESPWTSKNPPPEDWPKYGQLILKNLSLKYNKDDPPVLKNLNVTIEPGWKVGVVGRTGAGKSSLISALFRLFADGLEGEIKIDGRDTSTLGLHELRSRLSIIPQQPLLFSESLRYNLDPFHTYSDMSLWDSLRQVELTEFVLDQKIMHGGNNLSIGQRQLICLARAILRNNRILVLDEATANIDSYTDELIQKTIRTRFTDCTVITIAHRLNTIIDSDRIIVMDTGNIVEFGCPHELLRDKPKGIFSQMVNNTGVTMAQFLREQAERTCLKNTKEISLDLTRKCFIEDDTTNVIEQSSL
ncbi:PREDICTED: multidrug resistance-associated protein 4-like [Eufriesea mexicana]|uniref:multidrug resistance-associated protein 4-like n=1 Tax=Eufriesea mexicana TaxID=516756 RepID=UPI00083BDA5F|nr:PREDICTED: multidrug resistance-associated protein 4-like [Eufriesea mexicana]